MCVSEVYEGRQRVFRFSSWQHLSMAAPVIRLAALSSPKLWRGYLFPLPLYSSSFCQNRTTFRQHPGERMIMSSVPKSKKAMVTVTYICRDGEPVTVQGKEGDSLLDIAVNNNLDLEGFGACEGTLACSTCHVILKEEDFKRLPDKPIDEELDMLDLAFGLTDTSRLGCQICVTKEFDGMTVELPKGVNDARNK